MAEFFLGANSSSGFFSLFDELYFPSFDGRLFVIKGGPGTGKSFVMKKAASEAEKRGYEVERIYCSSDPDSLDAVIIPQLKTSIADGTAPHTIEPRFPGAVETVVNLGEFWDTKTLYNNKEKIIEKTLSCTSCHERCIRFLKAYASLMNDCRSIERECVDSDKLSLFVQRTLLTEIGNEKTKKQGRVYKRFLSAVTPKGITLFEDTVYEKAKRIICIDDEYSAVSEIIIEHVLKHAVKNGFDVISCLNPVDPKKRPEHIIIPEKEICFFTRNSVNSLEKRSSKTIAANRFVSVSEMKKHSARIGFNRRAAAELLDEAVFSLADAKFIHDALEKFYINAMDFNSVGRKADNLIKEIFG